MAVRYLWVLALLLLTVSGVVSAVGCAEKAESPRHAVTQIIQDVNAQEAFTLIRENRDNPDFIIIDVRTPEEFAEGHMENTINIDFRSETFDSEIGRLDRNKTYLIYCRSGNRSRGALDTMIELNFAEVYHLTVGIVGWVEEGFPVVE